MRLKLLNLVVISLLAGCAPQKYIDYKEFKNKLSKNNFSKILMVGTGTSGTRFFLENLSDELNRKLKEKEIETEYHHLGNNQTKATDLYNEIISKNKFDAVLHFSQLDETKNPIVLTSSLGGIPLSNGSSVIYSYTIREIRFHQLFLMQYFDFSNMATSLIDVNLNVNMDFINPKDYKKLSNHIITSLKIEK